MSVFVALLLTLPDCGQSRATLQLEILALRHQIHVLKQSHARRLRMTRIDRLLWVWFSRVWCHWRATLVIVKPETVITWYRRGFALSGRGQAVMAEVGGRRSRSTHADSHDVGRESGAPRIHGVLKVGVDISQTTVAKYMHRRQPVDRMKRLVFSLAPQERVQRCGTRATTAEETSRFILSPGINPRVDPAVALREL